VDGLLYMSGEDVLAFGIGWPGVPAQVHTPPDLYEVAGPETGAKHPGRPPGASRSARASGWLGRTQGVGVRMHQAFTIQVTRGDQPCG
jgi:hypothetical protein